MRPGGSAFSACPPSPRAARFSWAPPAATTRSAGTARERPCPELQEQEVVGLKLVGVKAGQVERVSGAEVDRGVRAMIDHQGLDLGKGREARAAQLDHVTLRMGE